MGNIKPALLDNIPGTYTSFVGTPVINRMAKRFVPSKNTPVNKEEVEGKVLDSYGTIIQFDLKKQYTKPPLFIGFFQSNDGVVHELSQNTVSTTAVVFLDGQVISAKHTTTTIIVIIPPIVGINPVVKAKIRTINIDV